MKELSGEHERKYVVPPSVKIGHIHLKVTDLDRALGFYRDLLGFEVTTRYGDQAVFLSAGGYHHHIGFNTWISRVGTSDLVHLAGLFLGLLHINNSICTTILF